MNNWCNKCLEIGHKVRASFKIDEVNYCLVHHMAEELLKMRCIKCKKEMDNDDTLLCDRCNYAEAPLLPIVNRKRK